MDRVGPDSEVGLTQNDHKGNTTEASLGLMVILRPHKHEETTRNLLKVCLSAWPL